MEWIRVASTSRIARMQITAGSRRVGTNLTSDRGGNPRLSLDDTVKEVTFNRPIPAARFTIQFPQGALVEDLDPEPLRDEKARNQVNAAIAQRWTQRLDAKALPNRSMTRNSMRRSNSKRP